MLPPDFSEDSLNLRAGAVYMRLQENVVYYHGPVAPCGGARPVTDNESLFRENCTADNFAAAFDQGLLDGWLPAGSQWKRLPDYKYTSNEVVQADPNLSLTTSFGVGAEPVVKADEIVELSFKAGSGSDTDWKTYVYQPVNALPLTKELARAEDPVPAVLPVSSNPPASYSSLHGALGPAVPPPAVQPSVSQRQVIDIPLPSVYPAEPGRFHDTDTCPGCIARENEARKIRMETPQGMDDVQADMEAENGDEEDEAGRSDESEEGMTDEDEDAWANTGLGRKSSHNVIEPCPGVLDVLLTGSTDPRHGAAWHPYIYTGRVRLYDGLIGILRTPAAQLDNSKSNANHGGESVQSLGRIVFYGYLVGGRNFVGNYRVVGAGDMHAPGWEGAFSLGRRE